MFKRIIYFYIVLILFGCSKSDVKKRYYETGELMEVYETQGGVKHGEQIEYFKNGNIRLKQNWKNGQPSGPSTTYYPSGVLQQSFNYRDGKKVGKVEIFYESGTLMEEQFYNYEGVLMNFNKYKEDGKPKGEMVLMGYTDSDTLRVNDTLRLHISMANVSDLRFRTGQMIITSEFDEKGFPIDTLAMVQSDSNYYTYELPVTEEGNHKVHGTLQFFIPLDTIDGTYFKAEHFIQEYYITDKP